MLLFLLILMPYSVAILYAWTKLLNLKVSEKHEALSPEMLPEVTVIIAAKNEETNLPFLISDLQRLDYPFDKLNIFIVDNNSSDRTAEIIKKAEKINYLHAGSGGKKEAIALALKHAGGQFVLSTDADCRLKPGWIKAYVSEFIAKKADLVIGQVDPSTTNGIIGGAMQLEFLSLQAVTAGLALAGRPVMCNGANLGFRRSLTDNYSKAVNSSVKSGDDMFLLHHAKRQGKKIVWMKDKGASVLSRIPGDLNKYYRQRTRWASKSLRYSDSDTIFTGLSTIAANLCIVIAVVVSFLNPSAWILAIMLILVKLIPDLLILSAYLLFKKQIHLLIWFLPVSILYPFYAIITTSSSLFRRMDW